MMTRRVKTCVPCIHPEVKKLLRREIKDLSLDEILNSVADCPGTEPLRICMAEVGKAPRRRSAYQEFISTCMKGHRIKAFGQASGAMKECAREWRKQTTSQG